jgi:non-heme Fe2+,alpha-ketoglutarate-dependent halogenase
MNETENKDYRLSKDELATFERDGYIGPIKLYETDEMTERWNAIRSQLPDRSAAVYPDDSRDGVTNISNYDRHLDIDLLSEHIMHPGIVDRVVSILGPDVLCWRTEFFPKYPGDEGTDWHQASSFAGASKKPQIMWPSEDGQPAFGGSINVWTAFTDSTRENGCLQVMPGTHHHLHYDESKPIDFKPGSINSRVKDGIKRGFFGYDYRQLQSDPDWAPDESKAFPLVMKRGECVIFWSTLMHASLPHTGRTNDYRMGYVARYVPTQVRVYPDTDVVSEYGGDISLANYGTVLVAGEDTYGFNRIAKTNRQGYVYTPRRYAENSQC